MRLIVKVYNSTHRTADSCNPSGAGLEQGARRHLPFISDTGTLFKLSAKEVPFVNKKSKGTLKGSVHSVIMYPMPPTR